MIDYVSSSSSWVALQVTRRKRNNRSYDHSLTTKKNMIEFEQQETRDSIMKIPRLTKILIYIHAHASKQREKEIDMSGDLENSYGRK